jgi:hypothetical protein
MSATEQAALAERPHAGLDLYPSEGLHWHCKAVAELRHWKTKKLLQRTELDGNMLVLGGASLMWEYALGNGTTSTGSAKHYLNSKCALGIGNSSAAAANTQKALQGASKVFKVMSAGFPTHTTGSTVAAAGQYVLKSTFTTLQGNFTWWEFGVASIATTAAVQRLITRKVQNLLTKTSAATASLTLTLTLS